MVSKKTSDKAKSKTAKDSTQQPNQPNESFPIVGIGASAGGLEAFSQVLEHLPVDTGMAFVLVQHLDPAHTSLLAELLAKTTKMPVVEVNDGIGVIPNQVYVIPPNTKMLLSKNRLRLFPREKVGGQYLPVDSFLFSLAQECKNQAIGVILSGMESDGALGLAAIKEAGGITFAQDIASSRFPGMPYSAVNTGDVDFVLPPQAIAEELVKISHHPYLLQVLPDKQDGSDDRSQYELRVPGDQDAFAHILALLQTATGVDFTNYRRVTIARQLMRRMALYKLEKLEDYLQYLQENSTEVIALYQDFLITVTNFFRDSRSFEALKTRVFPSLLQHRSGDEGIRIWVAGCATGEEAYSIAICLLEFFEGMKIPQPPIQIFATDLNQSAIETARIGLYKASLVSNVSAERLQRFFTKTDRGYQIHKNVRELCVFAKQNLISDPPFARLDLISCQNVLIYLELPVQQRLLALFHYALKPTGFLLSGTTETIDNSLNLFTPIHKTHKIYTRQLAPLRVNFDFETRGFEVDKAEVRLQGQDRPTSDRNLQREADWIVLNRYAPVGVVVNEEMTILQFRGQTGAYLEPPVGTASLNLFKMVKGGLLQALRSTIQQAIAQKALVRREGIQMQSHDGIRAINIEVIPFHPFRIVDNYFLILFEEAKPVVASETDQGKLRSSEASQQEVDQEKTQLRQELQATKAYLQSMIEELEVTNQSLQIANEESSSSNEELQSTNEELQTAQEELQASNEELHTINEELQNRIFESNQVNADLQNLLTSTSIPIVMLDRDLRIRRFTPIAEPIFNLIPTDVGRLFSDLNPNIVMANLEQMVAGVMATGTVAKQEVQDQQGHWYSLQIHPYRIVDNVMDGVVLGLLDIDALKRGSILLQAARDYANAIVETVQQPLVVLDADLCVITANRCFYEIFQTTAAKTERRSLFELDNGQWNLPEVRSRLQIILSGESRVQGFEVTRVFERIGLRTMLLSACKIRPDADKQAVLLAVEDITERRQAEDQIKTTLQEKEVLLREIHHRVKNNLQIISSLLSLQSNRVNDPYASEVLEDSLNRVRTISLVHDILYQSSNFTQLNFSEFAKKLGTNLLHSYAVSSDAILLRVDVEEDIVLNTDKAILCGLIINELVINALKHGFSDGVVGEILIHLGKAFDHSLTLIVSNNGEQFPTDVNLQKLQSMGLTLVRTLVEQLKGTLELETGEKTIFKITFICD